MILVAGATGSLGGRIANDLLDRRLPVRILARPTSQHGPLRDKGAEIALGDLRDPASLDAACRGVDAVVTTATMSKRGDDSPENVDLRGNLQLIDAAVRAGVRRFVFTSTVGASPDSPLPLFRAKGAAEAHLRASGMQWTVLQPNAFMDVWFGMLIEGPLFSGRPVTLVGASRRRHSFVAERDVAAFAVAALDHPAAGNATIAIGGPEAVTLREVVDLYAEAAGRVVDVHTVAPGEEIPGLPPGVSAIVAGLEAYDSVIPMDETASRYGVSLTTPRAFVRSRSTGAPGA
jgi:NADH dehydrogenase